MIRLLIALAVGAVSSLFLTRVLIKVLGKLKMGQPILEEGPERHVLKSGTPTMGGIAIVMGGVLGYVFSHNFNGIYTTSGLLIMGAIMLAALVGFIDDHLKVSRERNAGLNRRTKLIGLLVVAGAFLGGVVLLGDPYTTISFTRHDSIGWDIGTLGWVGWGVLLIVASGNAVNLTDGLDGLTAGTSSFSFGAYVLICFWMFRNQNIYDVPHALDMAVIAAAFVGGCVGFLWWNAHPARIFMGDTGSLALGTGLACIALLSNTHLLLPIIGGLYVVETMSVMLQISVFKVTKMMSGSGYRLFRMAPIHHHFELRGWEETWVIVRFWIMGILLTAVALGLFYADYIEVEGL